MLKKFVFAAVTAAALAAGNVNAGIVDIDIIQQNGDVIFQYDGALDTTGLSSIPIVMTTGISSGDGAISAGADGTDINFYLVTDLIAPFGDGVATLGGTVTGDALAIAPTGFGLELDYVSGSAFSGSLIFLGQSFSTLGIDLFEDRTLSNGSNTVVVSSSMGAVNAVPLPAGLVLMLTALTGLGFVSRWRSA